MLADDEAETHRRNHERLSSFECDLESNSAHLSGKRASLNASVFNVKESGTRPKSIDLKNIYKHVRSIFALKNSEFCALKYQIFV